MREKASRGKEQDGRDTEEDRLEAEASSEEEKDEQETDEQGLEVVGQAEGSGEQEPSRSHGRKSWWQSPIPERDRAAIYFSYLQVKARALTSPLIID